MRVLHGEGERFPHTGLIHGADTYWPHYFSTYCIHELHADCRAVCKTCEAPCQCECHASPEQQG